MARACARVPRRNRAAPLRPAPSPPFFCAIRSASTRRAGARPFSKTIQGVTVAVPDSLLPAVAFDAYLGEPGPRAPPGAGRALSAAARLRLGQFYRERRRRAALGAPAGARVDSRGARRLRHRGRVRRVHREAFRDDARSGGARHRRVVPRLARPGTVDPAVAVPDPAARPQFQSRRRGPRRVHAGISAARSAAAPGGAFDGRRDRAGLPAPPSRICSPARRCPRRWSGCAPDACRRRWCAC